MVVLVIYWFSEKLAKTFVSQGMQCLYGCMKLKYQGHRHPLKIFKAKENSRQQVIEVFLNLYSTSMIASLEFALCSNIVCVSIFPCTLKE